MAEPPSDELENGTFDEGSFPERCPICMRINFRTIDDDYCEHFWATVYDGEMTNGPFSADFERLWSTLDNFYQTTDDPGAARLMKHLRLEGLGEVADALVNSDKLWWLDRVEHKNFIDAEASLASGSGWNLYSVTEDWFEEIIRQMERASSIAIRDAS